MNIRIRSTLLVTALVVATILGTSDRLDAQQPLLVDAAWLQENLDSPEVVVIHVSNAENYTEGHIPGARFVSTRDVATVSNTEVGELVLEMPDPSALQTTLRDLGISNDSHIVVYWGGEWVTAATRVVYTLDWAGLGDRTSLLNGGMTAWNAAGFEVSTEAPEPTPGDATVSARPELVVDAEWVQAHSDESSYQLVDARSAGYYSGVQEHEGRFGHIPGAGNVHWISLLDEETLLFKPESELRSLLSAGGIEEGDTVVAYCHIGQFATTALFVSRMLGHEVKLYDGAMQDWDLRELPLETSGGGSE